jgi:hypothetical protein
VRIITRKVAEPVVVAAALYRELLVSTLTLFARRDRV